MTRSREVEYVPLAAAEYADSEVRLCLYWPRVWVKHVWLSRRLQ